MSRWDPRVCAFALIALAGCGRIGFGPGSGGGDDAGGGDDDDAVGSRLTVQVSGRGRVTSTPPGIDCPGQCSMATGSDAIQLAATPDDADSHFNLWIGACYGRFACELSATNSDVQVTAAFAERANRAFVLTPPVLPTFGVAGAADTLCQNAAMAAGRPGTFIALIATSTTTAVQRLAGSLGWERVDGEPMADDPNDMVGGYVFYPVSVNQFGAPVPNSARVWTGTTATNCSNWSGTGMGEIGHPLAVGVSLADVGQDNCSVAHHLYCFEVGRTNHIRGPQSPSPTRIAFLSKGQQRGDYTLAGFDAMCNAEATAAGFPGTYLAVLGTPGARPESRFNLGGPPWKAHNGSLLAATAAGVFATSSPLINPLTQSADGSVRFGVLSLHWSGAQTGGGLPTSAETNSTWTATTGGSVGSNVIAHSQDMAYSSLSGGMNFWPVQCFQE